MFGFEVKRGRSNCGWPRWRSGLDIGSQHRTPVTSPAYGRHPWVQRDPGPTPTKTPRPESSPTVASTFEPQQGHSTYNALGPRSPTTRGWGVWAASGVRLTARPSPLHQPVMERNARPLTVTLHNAALTTTSARRAASQIMSARRKGARSHPGQVAHNGTYALPVTWDSEVLTT